MFDKIKKALSDKATEVKQAARTPPDPAAVPDVRGMDLAAIDQGVLSAYLGREVVEVGPLGPGGAEATSFIGQRVQERLREHNEAVTAETGVERRPGELFPGQIDGALARLRAQGMPEEQLRMAEARLDALAGGGPTAAGEGRDQGWSVTFEGDLRASVQVFPAGSEGAVEYDRLRARYGRENGTDGNKPEDTPLLTATVQQTRGTPYETYSLSGRLASQGPAHVAVAASPRVNTQTLAGLAAVTLRAAEPR